jgi:hypothetical protein
VILFAATAAAQFFGCDQPAKDDAPGDEALKARLEARAAARPARASMSFGYIHTLEGIPEGGPVLVETDEGAQIEIQKAYLVISAVEAHLCEPTPGKQGYLEPMKRLHDWLIPSAHAHVPSSATRLGTPFVEDLLAPGRARIVDEIAPPMGSYCALYAVASPADDDVINLSGLDTAEIVGKTLLLRGRYRPADDDAWQPFSSASSAREVIKIDAVDPRTGASPLKLDEADSSRMLLLDKVVSPDIFAGIRPQQLDGPAAADLVLERLEDRLEIHQFKRQKSE